MGDGMAKVRKQVKRRELVTGMYWRGKGGLRPFQVEKHMCMLQHTRCCYGEITGSKKKEEKRCNETSGQLFADGAV